jgi:hypothetical protein
MNEQRRWRFCQILSCTFTFPVRAFFVRGVAGFFVALRAFWVGVSVSRFVVLVFFADGSMTESTMSETAVAA